MIKDLIPRLAERGRIKIGEKGEMKTSQGGKQFAQLRKLDHMVITTMLRDAAGGTFATLAGLAGGTAKFSLPQPNPFCA